MKDATFRKMQEISTNIENVDLFKRKMLTQVSTLSSLIYEELGAENVEQITGLIKSICDAKIADLKLELREVCINDQ